MARKTKFAECYGPGVLVNLYTLMDAAGGEFRIPLLLGGWIREETVEGRQGEPWVFFRAPYPERKVTETYEEEKARHAKMRDAAEAMREILTKGLAGLKHPVPVILWCSEWGRPRAPTAPPPKGKKIKPYDAYKRAVRELKSIVRDRAKDIRDTLREIEETQEQGGEYDEYPGFVGCLDPTTGVIYEAGIEWPQYFQGCGGPGPWNEIIAFHLDLENPKDMLNNVDNAVWEAFDMAGIEL